MGGKTANNKIISPESVSIHRSTAGLPGLHVQYGLKINDLGHSFVSLGQQ